MKELEKYIQERIETLGEINRIEAPKYCDIDDGAISELKAVLSKLQEIERNEFERIVQTISKN